MFPVFRSLGMRYLLQHWDRSLLIVASIALGVATLVSTQILLRCLEEVARNSNDPASGSADLYVTNGEVGVRLDLLPRIVELPGVRSAQPLVFSRVMIAELDSQPAVFFGADLSGAGSIDDLKNDYEIEITWQLGGMLRWPTLPKVVVSRPLVERFAETGQELDGPIELRIGGESRTVLPIGIADLSGPAAKLGSYVIGTDVATAAELTGKPDRASRIDVFLAAGADPTATYESVRDVVANRAMVRTRQTQGQSTEEVIGGVKAGFHICSAGAMVVGLFLVYNALSVSVAERRHDIGIIRSLGSTRSQVAGLFAIEAVVLGLGGALLGIPMGTGLAYAAIELLSDEMKVVFLTGAMPAVLPDQNLILAALAAGLATSLGAALLPALGAAADEPADAARRAPSNRGGLFARLHLAACGLLTGGGAAMIVFRQALPDRFGSYFGLVLILVGLLALMPLVVKWAGVLLRPLARRFAGIEERIAAENVTRAAGRTGVVVGAFGAGVALMVQIAGVGRSNEEPVLAWLDRVVKAELFLFAGDLASANSSSSPMNADVGRELEASVSGVERVVGLRYARIEFAKTLVYVIGIDSSAYATGTAARQDPPDPALAKFPLLLQPNSVLISDNFAVKYGVGPGDTVTLPGPDGPVRLRVRGTVQDYSWAQGTIIMDRSEYARLFQDDLIDFYHVYVRPEFDDSEVRARAERFAAERALMVAGRDEVREYVAGLINRIYQLAYLQQVIVGVVASLGIVMAVLISVLQRQRELGLLRAVGATRTQVLRSVLSEAVLMGLLGTLLGVLIGIPLAWYILKVVLYEESGFVFELLIPWREGLGIAFGAMLVASLAGLMPALQAMRLRITDAISFE